MIQLWLSILLSASMPAIAGPPLKQDCHQLKEPVEAAYCVTTSPGSRNPDFLYFLHGKGEDEQVWLTLPGNLAIAQAWADAGFEPPTVVSISFGSIWLLADSAPDGGPGLLGYLADTLIPEIEKDLGGLRGRRLLMGDSMGGFNATQLLLKRGKLFSRVVLACPAITTISPYSSIGKIFRYMTRTHASLWKTLEMLILARYFYPSREDWNEASPLLQAGRELDKTSPGLHVSCGSEDEYGFFEGAEHFARIARERGVPDVVWKLVPGGHCSYDSASIAAFLSAPGR